MEKRKKKRSKRKQPNDISWGKAMATTTLMILLVVAASFCVIGYINHMEEKKCFERLYEEADELAEDIEMYAAADREELELLAAVIAKFENLDSPDLWNLLDSYTTVGMMSRIELLIPGDKVLVKGGKTVDAKGQLSFEKEASLGAHITDREADILDKDNYIVRHYVPVIRDGKTVAMLYGVIELGELPEEVNLKPYGGKGAVYIIDGSTGDLLVDTWHPKEGGNMWEMGQREMAPGYDPDQMKKGVIEGESRYVVFVSKTVGEYLYFYYTPMEINQWRIAVSVPESIVFESAKTIERILNVFLLSELFCFIVYFLWMAHYVWQVTREKQLRLDMLNHIYDVEKLLFNAHEKKENMNAALEKIGSLISAEKVIFWILGQPYGDASFSWEKAQSAKERKGSRQTCTQAENNHIERLYKYFEEGNNQLEADDEEAVEKIFPGAVQIQVHNLIAVPIEDTEGRICGILECRNAAGISGGTALLKNMKFSFSMFCHNLKIYTEIKEQGDRDVLTGLYNRNRYERDRQETLLKCREALACIYIDVNGLHEMNNTQGHDKGDRMLKTVAEEIRRHFNTEYIYRMGGDEFIVFMLRADENEVKSQCKRIEKELGEKDYHISVGMQWEKEVLSMKDLIKSAEKKMYAEKKRYYEMGSNDRRRSARN